MWQKLDAQQGRSDYCLHPWKSVPSPRNESDTAMTDESEYHLLDKEDDIERASRSLKAMSHPLRLKILCVLGDRELSVQDIVEHVGT